MNSKLYVADTENTVPRPTIYGDQVTTEEVADDILNSETELDEIEAGSETRVWAWGLAPALEHPSEADVLVGNSVESFVRELNNLKSGSTVYFHNLAYDGPLILTALTRMGYVLSSQADTFRKPPPGTFVATISDNGVWYSLSVTLNKGAVNIVFKDSMKILPFAVDTISKALQTKYQKLLGTIDYAKPRPVGYQPTDIEIKYVKNDVLVMSEAIAKLDARGVGLTKALTIGQACMTEYKTMLGAGNKRKGNHIYNELMGEVSGELDADIRKAYRGGWCYVNRAHPKINKNQVVDLRPGSTKGNTYDVVSLYPSAMYKKKFPMGDAIDVAPEDFDPNTALPFFVKVDVEFTLKPSHLPFIQLKGTSIFAENDYPEDSKGIVELTLAGPDYKLFMKHYDVHYLKVVKAWVFLEAVGLFDEYIDHWYHLKETATNPVDRMIAKLMLNNLYGKMAQGKTRNSGVPFIDENGILKLGIESGEQKGGYIPVGAYITAYARSVTVTAAQNNYDNFLYADTDSVHIVGEAVGLDIGTGLGQWDHESTWDVARFTRQKTYMERLIAKPDKKTGNMVAIDPHISIKAAGATHMVKNRMAYKVSHYDREHGHTYERFTLDENDNVTNEPRTMEEIFTRFTHGLSEGGKLRRQATTGGSVLLETTFKIHVPEGVEVDPETGLAPTEWVTV